MIPETAAAMIVAALLAASAPVDPEAMVEGSAPESVKVGTAWGVPGRTVRGALKVAETTDGAPVELPIAVITGLEPGPVVWVTAASHGDEYGGARALQDVVQTVDPETMSGTLVAVMIANPLAFRALFRVDPAWDDMSDPGMTYPGHADRFATERVTAAIFDGVTATADYFIELHSGGDRFRQHPFVFYSLTGAAQPEEYDELARGFDIPTLWRDTTRIWSNSSMIVVGEAGIPSFLLGVGGGQPLEPTDTRLQANAILSFLRSVGVVPGDPGMVKVFTIVTGYEIVTNSRGGFFDAAVRPGERIREGAVLGTIVNVHGDVVETLLAPAGSEIVLGVNTYPASPTGGWLFEVGTGLSERREASP